jgi:hypothetical protein
MSKNNLMKDSIIDNLEYNRMIFKTEDKLKLVKSGINELFNDVSSFIQLPTIGLDRTNSNVFQVLNEMILYGHSYLAF